MTLTDTIVYIQAPPDRVWAALRDLEHWPEWTATVTDVRLLDLGPLAVGNRAIVRQPKLLPARWQITEVEEGCGFTWITRRPGILVTARHAIKRAGNGSRVLLSLDFSGPLGGLAAHLTRSLNVRYLALEAQGLKKRAEADAQAQVSKMIASEYANE